MIRTIGKTDTQTSALGMGCWAIGGEWTLAGDQMGWGRIDESQAIATIQAAYDAGIRVFDTAANYGAGLSEILVGKALAGRRSECIISTKFGFVVNEAAKTIIWPDEAVDGNVAQRVATECEESLRRLGTDYIDIYFFHQWEHDPAQIPDLRLALDRLVEQGKIRSYGWSTDDPKLANLLADSSNCQTMQMTLNVVQDNPAMVQLCESQGLSAFNKSPLAMGFLSGKYSADTQFGAHDVRSREWPQEAFQKPIMAKLDALRDILTSGGRTLVQGSLAWIWARSQTTLPIPGIRTVKQAQENAKAMEFGPLTPAQFEEVEQILGRRD